MKIIHYISFFAVLLSFMLTFLPKNKEMKKESCLSEANFEIAYRYIQWKYLTAKKLSKNHKVLFGDSFELEATEDENANQRIVFSKKGYKYFSIDPKKGYIPHTKTANDDYDAMFCTLLQQANFQNLPSSYHYQYIDGNGNLWRITKDSVQYVPIKPENSSSGFYSGGEPFEKKLEEAVFQHVETLFLEALRSNPATGSDHQLTKGTATVVQSILSSTLKKSYLTSELPQRIAIEQALEALKTK